jgi:hypothetical protein
MFFCSWLLCYTALYLRSYNYSNTDLNVIVLNYWETSNKNILGDWASSSYEEHKKVIKMWKGNLTARSLRRQIQRVKDNTEMYFSGIYIYGWYESDFNESMPCNLSNYSQVAFYLHVSYQNYIKTQNTIVLPSVLHECPTCCLTLRDVHRLKVLGIRITRETK